MPRTPHYIPPNHSNEMPSNCIWFDTETKARLDKHGRQAHRLWFGWLAFQRRWQGDTWTAPDWHRFRTRSQFWDLVEARCRPRTRLYLFAHNGAFDLPVMGAFSELPARGFKLIDAVVDAPPMILVWKRGNQTIKFIDTLNLWRVPLTVLGQSVGLDKLPMPAATAGKRAWDEYGKRDTEIIRIACRQWFDFLKAHDLGGFAPTLASQAFNAYRHRFMPVPIFADTNEKALQLSRDAYLGGRVECRRLGTLKGTFFKLDVNSMYPAVMQANSFPCKLLGVYGRPSAVELRRWVKRYCVIADCVITTKAPLYPVVIDGRLVFPIGTFRVTLATPEFQAALARGDLVQVDRVAVYEAAALFTDFVRYLYAERRKAIDAGNPAGKFMHRILMNSLYGKFGQRGRHYETVGESPLDSVRVWDEIDLDAGQVYHYREFGGIVQEWVEEGEARHSMPAIAAHVCSYARLMLWEAIQRVGGRHWLYCDTDSLIVDGVGLKRMQAAIDESALGGWKVEQEISLLTLHGPKDYVVDGERTLKGVRALAVETAPGEFTQDHFVGFRGLLREGSLDAPLVYPVTKTQARIYRKGTTGKGGWVSPLRLGRSAGR